MFSFGASAIKRRVNQLAGGRRINRSASCYCTKYASLRGERDGRPMGADGAADAPNERSLITQLARARACSSRATWVTACEVAPWRHRRAPAWRRALRGARARARARQGRRLPLASSTINDIRLHLALLFWQLRSLTSIY